MNTSSDLYTIDSLAVEFETCLVFSGQFSFWWWKWQGRMVVIQPIFAYDGNTECVLSLEISIPELNSSSDLYTIVSLTVEFEICLVFSGRFVFWWWKWHDGRMVVIQPTIFTSDVKTDWSYLYNSLVELAVSFNLYSVQYCLLDGHPIREYSFIKNISSYSASNFAQKE